MTAPTLADDLALARELAARADALSLARYRAADLVVTTKPDSTNVTDADRAVEQAIRARLQQERPEDSILGEEFGIEGASPRQWIIDPIDGTANYMRGIPGWATLISLEIDGIAQVGVVSAPAAQKRWWAARGAGAWLSDNGGEPRPLRVSGVSRLTDAWLSFQSLGQWDDAGYLDTLTALSRSVWRDRAFGDSWGYMLLAEGVIDIVGEFDVKPYDLSAVITIVEEAGGRFTGIDGTPGSHCGNSLATNGLLHQQALDILAR
ncbi:histidinol-phosphatase [Klugiella xanthotipulae]|uniref:Histidinol-phosphatase n=1 Tax=Klugiella xanthotipulae TaxID=244735 RepID=A0A543I4I4_9MICO|nr:inositol monophosphatase family protein [Klugiella xanthotipulae]TQM65474.1 histidinol-phosphate phosphatase [Klugiella xanthotipulae]